MNTFIKWIEENKQWLFEGLGVAVITAVIGVVGKVIISKHSDNKNYLDQIIKSLMKLKKKMEDTWGFEYEDEEGRLSIENQFNDFEIVLAQAKHKLSKKTYDKIEQVFESVSSLFYNHYEIFDFYEDFDSDEEGHVKLNDEDDVNKIIGKAFLVIDEYTKKIDDLVEYLSKHRN